MSRPAVRPPTRRYREHVSESTQIRAWLDRTSYAHLKAYAFRRQKSLSLVVTEAVAEYLYRHSRCPVFNGNGDRCVELRGHGANHRYPKRKQ